MIYTVGEILAEFVSHEIGCGLMKTTEFSGPYPSGAPAIFIDQVARTGGEAAVIGTVGDDPFGAMIRRRLADDGVDVRHVHISSQRTTGTAFVSYLEDGARNFVFHLEATAADDLQAMPTLEKNSILHVSGASLGNSNIRSAVDQLVSQAQSHGRISYDPNIRSELMQDSDTNSIIEHIVDACDIFLPSDSDMDFLFPGLSAEAVVEKFISLGKSVVVVKQGSNGVIGSDGHDIVRLPAHEVTEVDPTGAGDCFCGTLVSLLDQGQPFAKALAAANMAGALHVTRRGPMEWNPTLTEIDDQLRVNSA